MAYDVVVVGGGIGGLTAAALLAARGLNICLLERQSQVGGCVGRVQFSGHDFEPGMGLYTSFDADGIYAQIFSELPVPIPENSPITNDYVVRLSDGTDVRMYRDEHFFDELRGVFPDCADAAIEFYRKIRRSREKGRIGRFRALWTKSDVDTSKPTSEYLTATSPRFREFINVQLSAFLHSSADTCSVEFTAPALELPRATLHTIAGNPATLAECLAKSLKQSGGTLRLNSPVLRLAYDQSGNATGVDLLSGETVTATRAIISNMTVWDTFGKLVGLNRTPSEIKKALASMQGTGAYLIYASMEIDAAARLPSEHFLVSPAAGDDETMEFTFAAGSGPSPTGRRAVTLKMRTEVDEWFTFQSSEEDHEERDQIALEQFWQRLHRSVHELGGGIEVIETANPRTFYDLTRRKLGMVMGVNKVLDVESHQTTIPNLFMVGDTVCPIKGLSSVTQSALTLANLLTK